MGWASNGTINNPVPGQIMADSGAIVLGLVTRFNVSLWGAMGGDFELALRNAANSADVSSQMLRLQKGQYFNEEFPLTLAINQRIVVRAYDSMTGDFQAAISW